MLKNATGDNLGGGYEMKTMAQFPRCSGQFSCGFKQHYYCSCLEKKPRNTTGTNYKPINIDFIIADNLENILKLIWREKCTIVPNT